MRVLLLLIVACVAVPARAQECGNTAGATACPFDEQFVPCAPSCIGPLRDPAGRQPAGCRCPTSRYVLGAAEMPCEGGTCPSGFVASGAGDACRCTSASAQACPRACGDSTECCEDEPTVERYSTMRCWPFFDVDGDTAVDPEDEAVALSALWGACENNLELIQEHDRRPGVYVTRGETRPAARGRWECRSEHQTRACRGSTCHTLTITSPYSLSTPANAPNGQQFFERPHLQIVIRLDGDFANQSCSTWKDHAPDHSIDIRAANLLLGATMIGSEIVGDNARQDLSFEATESCIIAGNYTGVDEERIGFIPPTELDCKRRRNWLRAHGTHTDRAVILKAPTDGEGLIDLAYPFSENPSRWGRWYVRAQRAGICVQAATTRNVEFTNLVHEACGVIFDCQKGRRINGSCAASFCGVPTEACTAEP
jgi:hypothetical protein